MARSQDIAYFPTPLSGLHLVKKSESLRNREKLSFIPMPTNLVIVCENDLARQEEEPQPKQCLVSEI